MAKLSPVRGAGFVLGAVLVAGLVMAFRHDGARLTARRLALPLCLAGGAVAFMAITGFGRADRTGNDVPVATRYVHLVAALLFPVLAVALDELLRWKRVVGIVAVIVLVAGVPTNVEAFRPHSIELYTGAAPTRSWSALACPRCASSPPNRAPFSFFEGPVTARWILAALDAGKLAAAPSVSDDERAGIALRHQPGRRADHRARRPGHVCAAGRPGGASPRSGGAGPVHRPGGERRAPPRRW